MTNRGYADIKSENDNQDDVVHQNSDHGGCKTSIETLAVQNGTCKQLELFFKKKFKKIGKSRAIENGCLRKGSQFMAYRRIKREN